MNLKYEIKRIVTKRVGDLTDDAMAKIDDLINKIQEIAKAPSSKKNGLPPLPSEFTFNPFEADKQKKETAEDEEKSKKPVLGDFEEITSKNGPKAPKVKLVAKKTNTRRSPSQRKNRDFTSPKVAQAVLSEACSVVREYYAGHGFAADGSVVESITESAMVKEITSGIFDEEHSEIEKFIRSYADKFLREYNKANGTSFAFTDSKTDATAGLIRRPRCRFHYWSKKLIETVANTPIGESN